MNKVTHQGCPHQSSNISTLKHSNKESLECKDNSTSGSDSGYRKGKQTLRGGGGQQRHTVAEQRAHANSMLTLLRPFVCSFSFKLFVNSLVLNRARNPARLM